MIDRLLLHAAYAWDQSTNPCLARLRAWVDTTVPGRRRSVVSGTDTDTPTLAYRGPATGIVNILELLERRREELGGATSWRSDEVVPRADLIAIGGAGQLAQRLPVRAALVLPFRVHLQVDVSDGPEDIARRISKREREKFRSDRRSRGWALQLATDQPSFDYFYDRMHVPTMRTRHGSRTRSSAKNLARECLFRRGGLFFVTTEDTRVAGALCHWNRHSRTLTMRLLGVLDGDQRHYDSGAFRALYHLLLEWACHNGIDNVDFGGTEAWIAKGIFQWKRKFGPRVIPAPNHYGCHRVWWRVAVDTPAVRTFLVDNPVLESADTDQFRAVYFHDDERPPRLDIAHRCANVQQFRTVHLDSFLAGLPTTSAQSTAGGSAP